MVSVWFTRAKDDIHTPGLNLHGDKGLSSGLGLVGLLGLVLLETLVALSNNLGVLLLRVGAEEVLIVILLGLVLGVGGKLSGLGAVGSEGLGGVTGEGGEFALVRGDVLVPAGDVGVLLSIGGAAEGLEGHDIGLAGRGAVEWSAMCLYIE
jgi:hypothetical protein